EQDRWERMTLATCERAEGSLAWGIQVAQRCVHERVTPAGIAILKSLLRGRLEPWERARVAEISLGALGKSSGEATLEEARQRLRGALVDLGFFDAVDM